MIKVFYTHKQAVDQGEQGFGSLKSPSAKKPSQIAEALKSFDGIEFMEPNPVTIDDLKLCHDSNYVDGIMMLQEENGFGNKSKAVAESLLYTNGAMCDAAFAATSTNPTCALVSGFHHAGYNRWKGLGYFCTFNGLMITAAKLIASGIKKVAIIDCDMHWGNGTDDILEHLPKFKSNVIHNSFGVSYFKPEHSKDYLQEFEKVRESLISNKIEIILFQAGADVHVDDPFGGVLTTKQMYERDIKMFAIAKELKIPLAWNLAGGYQINRDGSYQKVIDLHLNTFKACKEVY